MGEGNGLKGTQDLLAHPPTGAGDDSGGSFVLIRNGTDGRDGGLRSSTPPWRHPRGPSLRLVGLPVPGRREAQGDGGPVFTGLHIYIEEVRGRGGMRRGLGSAGTAGVVEGRRGPNT